MSETPLPQEATNRKPVLQSDGPILLIDWSVISYKCWHRMGSSNYVPVTKTEKSEFARNLYLYVSYLVTRFKPAETIFAVDDNPNWRVQYYRDYYIKKSTVYYSKDLGTYVVEWDFKIHKFTYNSAQDIWLKKKLTKKEIADVVLSEEDEVPMKDLKKKDHDPYIWNKFSKGIPDYEKIEDLEEKNEILYTTLYRHFPRYKKRDKTKNWDFETPYEEFKEKSFNFAFRSANTFDAKAIVAKGAEADDIIAAYVEGRAKTGRDCIVVSVDQDLYQLQTKNTFFHYFNPNVFDGQNSLHGGFVELDPKKAKHALYTKILSGDTSDTIYAVFKKDHKKLLSEAEVEAIMLENDKPLTHAQSIMDRDVLIKNTTLIHLGMRPNWVYENIVSAIRNYKKQLHTFEPADFKIREEDEIANRMVAKEHKKYDEGLL